MRQSKRSIVSAFEPPSRSFPTTYKDRKQPPQHDENPLSLEFRDDDDMITLDTQSTMTKPNSSPVRYDQTQAESEEGSIHFFARMEGMLERVEERIMEDQSPQRYRYREEPSRPSDELKASLPKQQSRLNKSPKTRSASSRRPQAFHDERTSLSSKSQYHDASYRSSSDDDDDGNQWNNNETFDDDSTNVIATQVAERRVAEKENKHATVPSQDFKKPHPLNTFQQRPTHIVVDTSVPSPAHTNITMDATMMNETHASLMGFDDDNDMNSRTSKSRTTKAGSGYDPNNDLDNISTVTPVLDRYRLDPDDDNSIGVRVVPNQRRSHHNGTPFEKNAVNQPKQRSQPLLKSLPKPKTPKQTTSLPSFSANDFLSPKVSGTLGGFTPTNCTQQNKKLYRKTPFPKQKPSLDDSEANTPLFNENEHPNISTGSSGAVSPEKFQSMSMAVPPLRPQSLETRRVVGSATSDVPPQRSFPAFRTDKSVTKERESFDMAPRNTLEESATIDHIDKTIERIDQELAAGLNQDEDSVARSSGRVDPIGKSFLNQVKSMPKPDKISKTKRVKQITASEFEAAPQVVKTRVSIDAVNAALDRLQEYGIFDSSVEFSENRGHEILQSLSGNEFKSKTILISLCQWQRLSMRKVEGTMMFVVNSETARSAALKFQC
ncbi:MAG: hypothetical protein SGILL_000289 [Bacillariaceae sp.]